MDPMSMMRMTQNSGGTTDIMSVMIRMMASGGQATPGMNFGMDGTQFSSDIYDRGGRGNMPQFGGNNYSQIGYGNNQGMVPGFGGFNGMQGQQGMQGGGQQMMQMMMMMMMMMMQMMQKNGMGANPMQQQQKPNPFQQQNPNQQGQGGGQTIELQKGQTFTTPGGCTVNWKENTVKVHEPGGGQRDLADGFATSSASSGNGSAAAAAAAWGNSAAAAAAAAGGGAAASASAVSGAVKTASKPRDWKVWGDPHIQNPDGSKQEFKTKNACFTLQDGTKVLMCADKPDGNVNKVRITLPGGQMNLQGIDQKQTAVYGNDGNKFQSHGTLDQYMNAFPNAGFNQSPQGNQMFQGPQQIA